MAAPRALTPSRSRTIPARLHAATLERLREIDPDTLRPHTCASVARWLGEVHGIHVHRLAVQRLRAAAEKHSAAQVTDALRGEIAEKVPGVLAKVSRILRRLDERARTETNTQKLAAATSAATRALHELATLGGVAAPIAVDLTTNGHPITLRWADEPADDHAPAAPPGAAGGGP